MTIPKKLDDLTPEWLSDALGRKITAVRAEPVGVGVGLVGTLFRLTLTDGGAPLTMIAKLAAPTDEGRFVATIINMYGREVGFYTQLSERTPIPHPQCFYAEHDPATQDTVLLLEDVSQRGTIQDQLVGCDVADTGPALRTLARLHAEFWDDSSIAECPFLLRLCDDPYPGAVSFAYDTAWPRVQEFFPEQMTDRVLEFGNAYGPRIPALFAKLCEGPLVLSHCDWRLDNLFLTDNDEVIAVDWQLIDRSVAPRDVAYFVSQSVNVTAPEDQERLFGSYLEELGRLGVQPDREWAWEMYRYGTMMGFVYPVVAAGALSVEDPLHMTLTGGMLQRSIAAIETLDAFDLPL
jgi:Phosphotransferase enzyme family